MLGKCSFLVVFSFGFMIGFTVVFSFASSSPSILNLALGSALSSNLGPTSILIFTSPSLTFHLPTRPFQYFGFSLFDCDRLPGDFEGIGWLLFCSHA